MAKSATLEVNPALVRWARESSGLSIPEVAKRVGVTAERLGEWETTVGRPTARQLERLADALKRPVVAFLMPTAPQEPPLPADFRVVAGGAPPALSPKARVAIRRARRLVRIYGELGEMEPLQRPQLRITRAEGSERAAAQAREVLGVSLEEQAQWADPKVALETWRSKLERLGFLVFQFSMPDDPVSGFSLSETPPAIALNKRDHESRRCFTLFHEWAHLLLGEPGVCLVDEGRIAGTAEQVEWFCNAFAGALLVPSGALATLPALGPGRVAIEAAIQTGTRRFSVSRWVVLLRALAARAITAEDYRSIADRWNAEPSRTRARGGRNYPHQRAISDLGVPFVSRVMTARESGLITDADASDYLSLKLRWFADVGGASPRQVAAVAYVIDTCSLFELKRFPQDVFPSLWTNIDGLVSDGRLIAPHEVSREVDRGDDEIRDWSKARPGMFVDLDPLLAAVVEEVLGRFEPLRDVTRYGLLFADPIIVGLCLHRSRTDSKEPTVVVTEERMRGPGSLRIPNLCAEFGLLAIPLIELFKRERFRY